MEIHRFLLSVLFVVKHSLLILLYMRLYLLFVHRLKFLAVLSQFQLKLALLVLFQSLEFLFLLLVENLLLRNFNHLLYPLFVFLPSLLTLFFPFVDALYYLFLHLYTLFLLSALLRLLPQLLFFLLKSLLLFLAQPPFFFLQLKIVNQILDHLLLLRVMAMIFEVERSHLLVLSQ